MDYFVVIIFFGLVILSFVLMIYNNTSHSKTNGNILKEDALICDIKILPQRYLYHVIKSL